MMVLWLPRASCHEEEGGKTIMNKHFVCMCDGVCAGG